MSAAKKRSTSPVVLTLDEVASAELEAMLSAVNQHHADYFRIGRFGATRDLANGYRVTISIESKANRTRKKY